VILSDYWCTTCADSFEALVPSPSPDEQECPHCGELAGWLPTPIHGSVQVATVERGKVTKPDSPMFCDTRSLGEGQPLKEWKEQRKKLYVERRHKESKGL
jgi:hypothetical protein